MTEVQRLSLSDEKKPRSEAFRLPQNVSSAVPGLHLARLCRRAPVTHS